MAITNPACKAIGVLEHLLCSGVATHADERDSFCYVSVWKNKVKFRVLSVSDEPVGESMGFDITRL
jgi:hypothetical protein